MTGGMTQVNLLPADVRSRQKIRRITAASIGAVAAVMVLMLLVVVMESARLARVNSQLAAQESVNAGLNSKIAGLQTFEDLRQSVAAKQALVDGLNAGQILWSNVLQDISATTPDGLGFTAVTGALAAGPTGPIAGTISFQGKALNHLVVADWLSGIDKVPGWANSWVSSVVKETTDTSTEVVFSGSVDVTTAGTSNGRPR
jgi:Tfp pilus assembly protein PilN